MGSADATLRRGCERDVLGCEQAFYHEFDQSGDRNASVNGPLDVFRLSPSLDTRVSSGSSSRTATSCNMRKGEPNRSTQFGKVMCRKALR